LSFFKPLWTTSSRELFSSCYFFWSSPKIILISLALTLKDRKSLKKNTFLSPFNVKNTLVTRVDSIKPVAAHLPAVLEALEDLKLLNLTSECREIYKYWKHTLKLSTAFF